ncbi:MAG: carboxypeptidase regulatory-like domain-containing protein, partial [Planctomycetota bacterium]
DVKLIVAIGAVIQGRVYGPNHQPLAGAIVKANATGAKAGTPVRVLVDPGKKTDETGLFRFDSLEPGEYRIVASHADYASAILVKIQPNGGDLTIELPVGAAIGGMVMDSMNNQPIAGAEVSMQDSAGFMKKALTDASGLYELRGVTVEAKRSRDKDNDPRIQAIAPGYARNSNTVVQVVDGKLTPNQDIQLDRACDVSGRVTDATGKGLGGVRLSVMRAHNPSLPMRLSQGPPTESSPDGTFLLRLVSPGSEAILVGEHPDYLESETAPFELAPGQSLTELSLVMRVGGKIKGLVVDEANQPLKGATVGLAEGQTGPGLAMSKRKATSDAAGRFELHGIEAGEHMLLAEMRGFLDYEQADVQVIEGQATADIVVMLTKGSTITGTVLDSQGQPIVNATIKAVDTSLGMRQLQARSDTSGHYLLDELGPDPVDLNVEAQGYSKETRHQVPVNTEQNDFTMRKLGKIIGRVVDQNGVPPQAFSVAPKIYMNDRYLSKVPPRTISIQPGEDGRFEFSELETGTYQVTIGAPGYTLAMFEGVEIVEDGVHDVGEVVLNEGGKIGGIVIDEANEPVFGANIILVGAALLPPSPSGTPARGASGRQGGSPRRRTDRDGRFLIEGLAQNEVQVRIEHRQYLTQTVTLRAGDLENTIILTRGGIIEGKITGSNGEARESVQLMLSGEGHSDRVVTDRKGFYTFGGLQDGTYTIRVTQFGTGGQKSPVDLREAPTYNVSVYGGQTQTLDITDYDGPSAEGGDGRGGNKGEDRNN